MPFGMNVEIAGSTPLQFNLADGRYRIGSRPECEIHIDLAEVTAVAAQLDVRGEAVFIRNMNPFSIYVGADELSSSQQAEWPEGQIVALSENVSLELFDVKGKSEAATAEEHAKRSRSTIQIAVTGLCLAAAMYLLFTEKAPKDSTKALRFDFTDLVQDLQQDKKSRHDSLLNYMIDARVADLRWGTNDPRRAISAYQLLLDDPVIRSAKTEEDLTAWRIKQFALARVDDLSGVLGEQ